MYGVVGDRFDVMPIALVEENTVFFPAGALKIGVEGRAVDPDAVKAGLGELSETARAQIEANQPKDLDDEGPSIHVLSAKTDVEYLRFDCFVKGAHYHYIRPDDGYQTVVMLDEAACGDPIDFAIGCLRNRLAPMLVETGQSELAQAVEGADVEKALGDVEESARRELARVC